MASAHTSELYKALFQNLLAMTWVVLCWLVPEYFIPNFARSEECRFRANFANLCFAALISLSFFTHIIYWITICCRKRRLQGADLRQQLEKDYYYTTIYSFLFRVFGLGSWFWVVQIMWRNFNSTVCLQKANLLDLFNFVVAVLYASPFGCILLVLILCCPFKCDMYKAVCRMFCFVGLQTGPGVVVEEEEN